MPRAANQARNVDSLEQPATAGRPSYIKATASADLSSQTDDPIEFYSLARSSIYKRVGYFAARPVLSWWWRRHLRHLRDLPKLRLVLRQRGFPLEARHAWLNRWARIRERSVLIMGAGSGWEALDWVRFQPSLLFAVDAYPFFAAWGRVAARMGDRGPKCQFVVSELEQLPLHANTIDCAVSDAVFEHCRDLPRVLRELYRVLKPDAYCYAAYGPLWYCFGGDHFSGRGGVEHGYNHIALPNTDYETYVRRHTSDRENAQSGPRYVSLDLFSKLSTTDYLQHFDRAGFCLEAVALELCSKALMFNHLYPERVADILKQYPKLCYDDLIIKGHYVILRKPAN